MNTHFFLSALCLGLASAVISVAMITLMSHEPILNWWFRFGERIGKPIVNDIEVERWFYKPIWGCEKCFAGQISLWVYIFTHIKAHKLQDSVFGIPDMPLAATPDFSFFCLLFAVSVAITAAFLFSHYINQKNNV